MGSLVNKSIVMKENILLDIEMPVNVYRDKLVEVPCTICGQESGTFFGKIIINGISLNIDYCKTDDLWWLNPRPEAKFYSLLYNKYFYNSPVPEQFGYAGLEADGARRAEKAVLNMDDIEAHTDFTTKKSFLEIGCATGEILLEAKKRGWKRALGIEIEERCCKIAKEKGLDVICSSFENMDTLKEPFDLIFTDNVIEHLLDPAKAILKCNSMQRQGSYFILRLPDTASCGPHLKLIDHTFHFTRKSIAALLQKYGYQTTDIFHSGRFHNSGQEYYIDNMTVVARKK